MRGRGRGVGVRRAWLPLPYIVTAVGRTNECGCRRETVDIFDSGSHYLKVSDAHGVRMLVATTSHSKLSAGRMKTKGCAQEYEGSRHVASAGGTFHFTRGLPFWLGILRRHNFPLVMVRVRAFRRATVRARRTFRHRHRTRLVPSRQEVAGARLNSLCVWNYSRGRGEETFQLLPTRWVRPALCSPA